MNEMISELLNSDIQENRELGSALLKSEHIPEKEREYFISALIEKFLKNQIGDTEVLKNVIEAYNNLSSNNIKNRIEKI